VTSHTVSSQINRRRWCKMVDAWHDRWYDWMLSIKWCYNCYFHTVSLAVRVRVSWSWRSDISQQSLVQGRSVHATFFG